MVVEPWQLVLLGAAILVISGWLLRMRARGERAAASPPPDSGPSHRHLALREGLDHLLVQIQETSREHIARLDVKIRLLQRLIDEADQRIRRLQELAGAVPPAPAPAPEPPPERPVAPLHREVYRLADEGLDVPGIAARTNLDRGEVDLILNLRLMKP